ncbi:MAG: NAD(P)H-hydrate dehydratase [Phycisphaerales bacterium]
MSESGPEVGGGAGGESEALPAFPARDPSGHKGTFGTVAVVGGCCAGAVRMVGAPALAAIGALRAGAGRARMVMPEPILAEAIAIAPSATGVSMRVDADGLVEAHEATAAIDAALEACEALVVGPGMGVSAGTAAAALRAVQGETPVVVDADALTALAGIAELHRDFRAPAVLTPHVGEFRRLAATVGVDEDPASAATRPEAAAHLARRLGCIVVLKGPGTVVSDGHRVWVNASGNAALATAGTGDVLAGVIAGIAAQFVRGATSPRGRSAGAAGATLDLFDAARLGVAAHGAASDLWVRRHGTNAGMLATELAELVPEAIEALRARPA